MLVLTSRALSEDFFEIWSSTSQFIPEERLHLMPKSSTLGSGLQYRYDLSDTVKLRLEYATLDYAETNTSNYVNYNVSLEMVSRPLILDWHPFGGAFRASVGVVFGEPTLSATAVYDRTMTISGVSVSGSDIRSLADSIDPALTLTVNQRTIKGSDIVQYVSSVDPNRTYAQSAVTIKGSDVVQYLSNVDPNWKYEQSAMTVDGRDLGRAYAVARYPNYAPYFGVGWGDLRASKGRLLYSIDIGAMYLRRPQVQLSLSGPVPDLANRIDAAATQAYLAQEQGKIEEALRKYRYFPVLSVGLWYRF